MLTMASPAAIIIVISSFLHATFVNSFSVKTISFSSPANANRINPIRDFNFMDAVWDLYIPIYDEICHLSPYQSLMKDISSKVDKDARNILDLGCGTGNVAHAIQKKFPQANFAGIDCSDKMLQRCKEKNPWMALQKGDLNEKLPYPDNHFDTVVCNNVLYLLKNHKLAVSEMCRILKPGGQFIISTPNESVSVWPILNQHLKEKGVLSLAKRLPSLVLAGLLNIAIANNGSYDFFSREKLRNLVGECPIEETFAGTCYVVSNRKSRDALAYVASSPEDFNAANELVSRRYLDLHKHKKREFQCDEGKDIFTIVVKKQGKIIASATILVTHNGESLPTAKYFGLSRCNGSPGLRSAEVASFAICNKETNDTQHQAAIGLIGQILSVLKQKKVPTLLITVKRHMHIFLRRCGIQMEKVADHRDLVKSNTPREGHWYFFPENEKLAPMAMTIDIEKQMHSIFVESPIIRTGMVSISV